MGDFTKDYIRPEITRLKPYVPGKPIEEVERELGISNVIKLASNENPLGPSPRALERVKEALNKISLYPDGSCHDLRISLSRKFGLNENCFFLGNGSDELVRMISETFLSPGNEVIYATPTFSEYEFVSTKMGGECIAVPTRDFKHDLKEMKNRITEATRMVYICNPNNPTGTMVTKVEIEEFMRDLPDHVLVIFDEAYSEYVTSEDFVSGMEYLNRGGNVIVLKTFSKVYGLAGLRLGYGITSERMATVINSVREPFNVNSLAQVAAIGALEDIQHLQSSQKLNVEGRDNLYRAFEKMGLAYVPTQANFIFVDVKHDCQAVFQALLRRGVIVRTGNVFGFPHHIRVTIGTASENERFIDNLKAVLEE